MVCSICSKSADDIVVFNNADSDTKVGICKQCLDAKVNKGIKNRQQYDVEKLISKSGFKQI